MIILHIVWQDGGLWVWGECAAARLCAPPRSPFDAGADRLTRALESLTGGGEAGAAAPCERLLALPTRRCDGSLRPLGSQPFLDPSDGEAADAGPALASHPWRVTAVPLGWRAALGFLGTCRERRLAEGVFAAEDFLRYAELMRYAGALVARGRYLPALRRSAEGSGYEAVWQPCIDREEARRSARLAERLPPCATGGQPAALRAAEQVAEWVDRLVRVSVATTLSRAHAERGAYASAHDAWLAALRGDSRLVRWNQPEELEALARDAERWAWPLTGDRAPQPPFTLELSEPDAPERPWPLRVRFAEAPRGRLDETAARALGQAAALYPPLAEARLEEEDALACGLEAAEAFRFLTVAVPLLDAAGYAVRLPEGWREGPACDLTLRAEAAPLTAGDAAGQPLDGLPVSVRWEVSIDGEAVTAEELEELLRARSPLVFFRGRWRRVDPRHLQNALRVARGAEPERQTAGAVLRLALGAAAGAHGLEVSEVRGDGWLAPLLEQVSGQQGVETLATPAAFCGELRPYQQRGFSWLVHLRRWGFGACLADDMGLGKTVQALAFLSHERACGERRPLLLVGPMSVLGNWLREMRRFTPELSALLHHGPQREHGEAFQKAAGSVAVVITSYTLLYRDYADLRKVGWAGILLDEAQNVKNPSTRQAQAARALQADYRLALTGTPLENHVGDLWSIMDFLNPGLLGRRAAFHTRFYRPIQSGADPGARTRLRRLIAPFILRRLKTDKTVIADLPDKLEGKVYCPLTREQARLYEEVLDTFQHELGDAEGIGRRGLILAVLTRLKQVCNHPAHYLGVAGALARRSGKLTRLTDMLEEAFARGESALVFTQYAEMGRLLQRHLCETFACDTPFLHGGLGRKTRDQLVQGFQSAERPLAFVLSLKAGGTGLNLTRATHVFHYDRWWNPAVENQATDRAFRIGQTRRVMVHKLICGGTLEERIDALIESKTTLAQEIVASGEAALTNFSDCDLRELLRLSEADVADEGEEER